MCFAEPDVVCSIHFLSAGTWNRILSLENNLSCFGGRGSRIYTNLLTECLYLMLRRKCYNVSSSRGPSESYSYKRWMDALCSKSTRSKRFPQNPRKTRCVSPLLSEGLMWVRENKRKRLSDRLYWRQGALKRNPSRRFTFVFKSAVGRSGAAFPNIRLPAAPPILPTTSATRNEGGGETRGEWITKSFDIRC